jgi:hypothetical protein
MKSLLRQELSLSLLFLVVFRALVLVALTTVLKLMRLLVKVNLVSQALKAKAALREIFTASSLEAE